jgi:CrcB protein
MDPMLVFVGGGTGAVLRWAFGLAVPGPWGTVAVNVIGSFVLALVAHPAMGMSERGRLLIGVGVLGGFTTYSTFNLYLVQAASGRAGWLFAGQLAATVGGALLAGFAGHYLAAATTGDVTRY